MIAKLKSKIHRAVVTDSALNYEGSLGIDASLMAAVGLVEFEKILVANISTGERFETYAIEETAESRKIVLRGAAARCGQAGDKIIIMSFRFVDEENQAAFSPLRIVLDENNKVILKKA